MGSLTCHFWPLVSSATYFMLFLQLPHLALAHTRHHSNDHYGIPTNVTKHLYFPSFTILNTNPTNDHIKLLGSATISQEKGFIQIPADSSSSTLDHANQAGRAIFSSPIRLFDPHTLTPASFNTTFSFQSHFTKKESGTGEAGRGDGLAFVIVPDEFTVGRPGLWLGILNDACDHYKVFAIEFDTVYDPEVGDPNDDHIGINLGSIVSFKVANLSQQAKVSLHDHLVHRAWIIYDGDQRLIEVYIGLDDDPVPRKPILSSSLNLAPFLNEYMFVGFSGSSGNSTHIHNILSWNFSSTVQALLHIPSLHTCQGNFAKQVSNHSSGSYSNPPSGFFVFVCVVGLFSLVLITLYCNISNYRSESSFALMFPVNQRPMPPNRPRRFTFLEVYRATRRFSEEEVLAGGSREALYRGTLPNGGHVAVKRFSAKFLSGSRLDWSRVLKRISAITSICHPGLASIRGWCRENREMIFVYDFFQNGSLDRWLHAVGALPWTRRLKLIKEIAEALSLLHSRELTHGNIKTSSVFLDVNYRAVLGDYGFIHLQGDSGIFDSLTGKKSDVFRFGMLVLEIVAGKRTIKGDKGEEEELGLLSFAWGMHERGEKVKVVDDKMGSCVDLDQAVRVLDIGLVCTLDENNGSPTMEEVVQFLTLQKQVPSLPPSQSAQLLPKKQNIGCISM